MGKMENTHRTSNTISNTSKAPGHVNPPLLPSNACLLSLLFVSQVNVEATYAGDPCLVTVAGYDAALAGNPFFDDYGIIYNDRSQVNI